MKNQLYPSKMACPGVKPFTGTDIKRVILVLFPFIFFFNTGQLYAQKSSKIDSLIAVVKTAKEDTSKVNKLYTLSLQLISARDYERAKQYADSALYLAEKLNFNNGIARAYFTFGVIEDYKSNFPVALENYQIALKNKQAAGDKAGIGVIYNNIGIINTRQGNYPEALKNHSEALKIREESGDKTGIAASLFNIGTIYSFQGNYPEALSNFQETLKIKEELGNKPDIARCYSSIGNIYGYTGNYPEALKYHGYALKIKEEIGDKREIAQTINNIGTVYAEQGNLSEALKNFRIALQLKIETGNKEDITSSYINVGMICKDQGNYTEALENFLQALKVSEEIGNKEGIASSYRNIGSVYESQGNYSEALTNYTVSLKILEEIGNKRGIAETNSSIGNIYSSMGNYSDALIKYQESLKVNEEIGDKNATAGSYNSIGSIYEIQGNLPEALKNHFACLKICEEISSKEGMACAHAGIGSVLYKQATLLSDTEAGQKYNEALQYMNKAVSVFDEIGNKDALKKSYNKLSEIDSATGNFTQALADYKLYTLYKDSLLNKETNKQIANLKISYETEKKDQAIELLNKDNSIKALQLEQQQVSLLASSLEAEKNQSRIILMDNSMEIQKLKLAETQKDLEHQKAEAEVKAAEMELLNKEKELNEQLLEKQRLVRNGMIAGIALLVMVGLLLFRSFRLRKKLEKQQAIVQERKRISADLHDDVGSGLSKISLLSELVKNEAKTPEAKKEAEKISSVSQELSSNISEIIWALNSNNDYLENLVAYIRRYAAEYFENSPVKLKIITPGSIAQTPISAERRRNIFYTVKEALHNIVKHAHATKAELNFTVKNNVLSIVILDNGIGIPQGELNRFGNGLNNMRNRMKSINGNFSIENHVGTKIILTLPV